jgi:AcrR family transcriptional regulator
MKNASTSSGETHPYHHGDLRRALIDAAMAMVREEQDWTFSLRGVARRAGVSHNAPYNHFANKRELLAAVAAAGFVALRGRMLAGIARTKSAEAALMKSGIEYVKFGLDNPAHYRLMFGSALMTAANRRPKSVTDAAEGAKAVLVEIIDRGAKAGIFAVSPRNEKELRNAVLFAWSAVHGLTMLAIDGRVGPSPLKMDKIAEKLVHSVYYGLARR